MLVLSRKMDEEICIGNDIKVSIVRIRGNVVRIGISAPRDIRVMRAEITDRKTAKTDPTHAVVEASFQEESNNFLVAGQTKRETVTAVGGAGPLSSWL